MYKSVCRELISLKYCILQLLNIIYLPFSFWIPLNNVYSFLNIFQVNQLKKKNPTLKQVLTQATSGYGKIMRTAAPPECVLCTPASLVSRCLWAVPSLPPPRPPPVYTLHTWKLTQIWDVVNTCELSTPHHTPVPLLEKIDNPSQHAKDGLGSGSASR